MDHSDHIAEAVETNTGSNSTRWRILANRESSEWTTRWDELNARSARSPLLDSRFVSALLRHFGDGQERIALLDDATATRAAGVVRAERAGTVWNSFQPSQAPIGLWMQDDGRDLVRDVRQLLRVLPGPAFLGSVWQLDPDIVPRPADGDTVRTLDYVETSRITLHGSFEEFWAARGKNLRHNINRQHNRLEREGVQRHFRVLDSPADMARAVAEYGALESRGWKAQLGTAIEPDNLQGKFYQDVLERFAESGQARCYQLYFGDRLVAMDLCVEGYGTVVILKTTHDEDCKGFSPGQLLHREEVPLLFEESDTQVLEFYGKVMDWHRKWSDEMRQLFHVNVYRAPTVARLHRAAGWMRRWVATTPGN